MLELIPLCTVSVDVSSSYDVGVGPAGARSVGHITAAVVKGERMNASLIGPSADWIVRTGAIGVIDVRMTVRTDDGALIHIQYGGRLDLSNPAAGIFAYVAPTFETGDERYAWLNAIQAVGKGVLSVKDGVTHIEYEFNQVR